MKVKATVTLKVEIYTEVAEEKAATQVFTDLMALQAIERVSTGDPDVLIQTMVQEVL